MRWYDFPEMPLEPPEDEETEEDDRSDFYYEEKLDFEIMRQFEKE